MSAITAKNLFILLGVLTFIGFLSSNALNFLTREIKTDTFIVEKIDKEKELTSMTWVYTTTFVNSDKSVKLTYTEWSRRTPLIMMVARELVVGESVDIKYVRSYKGKYEIIKIYNRTIYEDSSSINKS